MRERGVRGGVIEEGCERGLGVRGVRGVRNRGVGNRGVREERCERGGM